MSVHYNEAQEKRIANRDLLKKRQKAMSLKFEKVERQIQGAQSKTKLNKELNQR